MISIIDITTQVYLLLNVDDVLDYIGGEVYRGKSKDNSTLENIEILAGANVNDIAQDVTLFVNYHVRDLQSGEPDQTKMKGLSDIIVPLLEADRSVTILDEQIFPNRDRANWSYYSIRLMINTLNDNFTE